MFRKVLAVLAVMVLGMSAANAQGQGTAYFTVYNAPGCPIGGDVFLPQPNWAAVQSMIDNNLVESWRYRSEDWTIESGPCQSVVQQSIKLYADCNAMCQDDTTGAVNRAILHANNYFNCPGVSCTMPANYIIDVDILVADWEICNSYHYLVRLETKEWNFWYSKEFPTYESNPPVSLHCQNEIVVGGICGRSNGGD